LPDAPHFELRPSNVEALLVPPLPVLDGEELGSKAIMGVVAGFLRRTYGLFMTFAKLGRDWQSRAILPV
jgi:hypothetical protein